MGTAGPARAPHPRAFTLIELIVVIVILGVLAALAVPSFRSAQEKSRQGVADTTLQAVAKAVEAGSRLTAGAATATPRQVGSEMARVVADTPVQFPQRLVADPVSQSFRVLNQSTCRQLPLSTRIPGPCTDPTATTGLVAHYDAHTLTAGPVASLSGLVGPTLTEPVAAKQPQLDQTGLNGRPAMVFDGVDDRLVGALTLPQPMTVLVAARPEPKACCGYFYDSTVSSPRTVLYYSGTTLMVYAGAQFNTTFTPGAPGGVYTTVFNGPSSLLRIDGVQRSAGDPSVQGFSGFSLGARFSNSENFVGAIGEVLIYNRVLTAAEIAGLEGYLAARWGMRNS